MDMNFTRLEPNFLGIENKDGFNYPISDVKLISVYNKKNHCIKYSDKLRLYAILHLTIIICVAAVVYSLKLNEQILSYGLMFMLIPSFILIRKISNLSLAIKFYNFYIDRNNDILSENYEIQHWNRMIF